MSNRGIGVYLHETGEVFLSKEIAAKEIGVSDPLLTNPPDWLIKLGIYFFKWPLTCTKCGVLLDDKNKYPAQRRYICKDCMTKELKKQIPQRKEYKLKKLYGITSEIYNKMFEEQHGCCAICGLKTDKLNIDHNHITGKVRGLLCWDCNTTVGKLKIDNGTELLEKALEYVHKTATSI